MKKEIKEELDKIIKKVNENNKKQAEEKLKDSYLSEYEICDAWDIDESNNCAGTE